MEHASTTALLSGVVDYAGLFPPAGLSMADAAAEYGTALAGPHAWMLGRFVVPAARLPELDHTRQEAAARAVSTWRVSAIVRDGSEEDAASIAVFNGNSPHHYARVDSVEGKPQGLAGLDWLATRFAAEGFEVYVEIPANAEADRWLARAAERGVRAKVRTGGLSADAFPSPEALAAFLASAVRHGVMFKATAGLHHAVRGSYRLTYEEDAAQATMYGYLNVLLATALLLAGHPVAAAEHVLRAGDPASLVFADDSVRWGDISYPLSNLRGTRAEALVSFGSCSFREPVEELHALTSR